MLAPRKKLWSTPRSAIDVATDLLRIGADDGGGSSRSSTASATTWTAALTAEDVVYDVGCGDGSVLLRLAELHPRCGGRFVGIEIDPDRADEARRNVSEARGRDPLAVGGGGDGGEGGAAPEIEIVCKNALEVDYDDATVVFLYLVPRGLRLVKPLLLRHCQDRDGHGNGEGGGAGVEEAGEGRNDTDLLRVVTYMSPLEGEVPVATDRCTVDHQPGAEWPLYLYHFWRRRRL